MAQRQHQPSNLPEASSGEVGERVAARYRGVPLPTYVWQRLGGDFVLLACNDAAERITKHGIAGLLGKTARGLYQDEPSILRDFDRCYRHRTSVKRELRYRLRSTGEERWLDVTYVFVPPDLVVVHTEDIHGRKQAEEALRESEARWRSLVEHAPAFVCSVDLDGVIRFTNRIVAGLGMNDVMGTSITDWVPEEARAGLLESLQRVFRTREPQHFEIRGVGSDETTAWYATCIGPVVHEGEVVSTLLIATDITQQKEREQALEASEQRFRLFAEHAQDMLLRYRVAEPRGFEYVSPAVTRMAGYTPEQYYADPDFPRKVIYPDDIEAFERAVAERPVEPVELRWVCNDGSVIWTEQRNVYVHDDAGTLLAVESIVRDVTRRKHAEEEIQRMRDELEGKVEQQLSERNPYRLTFREFTVLHLVAAGKADKEVAQELGISPLTVHKHVANILGKMQVSSRTEAVAHALREGLLDER